MNPQDTSRHDPETLSALFDGELAGEARLFAMRRLAHDVEWQQACGRWQLVGDALRRQAPIAAPVDFAERVRARVAEDAAAVAPTAPAPMRAVPAPSRRVYGWAGGALAASIALAAVIGLRPGDPALAPAGDPAPAPLAVEPAAVPSAQAPAVATGPSVDMPLDATREAAPPRVVASVDAAPAPARGASAARPARALAVSRAAQDDVEPAVASPAVLVTDADNPFRLQPADSIDARPWPRASLGAAAAAGFTARYGSGSQSAADAPSFYPFEPRLESGADAGASPTP